MHVSDTIGWKYPICKSAAPPLFRILSLISDSIRNIFLLVVVRLLDEEISSLKKEKGESFATFESRVREWMSNCHNDEYVMDPDIFKNKLERAIDADPSAKSVRQTVVQIAYGTGAITTGEDLLIAMGQPMKDKELDERAARSSSSQVNVNAAAVKKKKKKKVAAATTTSTSSTAATSGAKQPCWAFAEHGTCKFADKCRFEHIAMDAAKLEELKAAGIKKSEEKAAARKGAAKKTSSSTASPRKGFHKRDATNKRKHKAFVSRLAKISDSDSETSDGSESESESDEALDRIRSLKLKHKLSTKAVIDIAKSFKLC